MLEEAKLEEKYPKTLATFIKRGPYNFNQTDELRGFSKNAQFFHKYDVTTKKGTQMVYSAEKLNNQRHGAVIRIGKTNGAIEEFTSKNGRFYGKYRQVTSIGTYQMENTLDGFEHGLSRTMCVNGIVIERNVENNVTKTHVQYAPNFKFTIYAVENNQPVLKNKYQRFKWQWNQETGER